MPYTGLALSAATLATADGWRPKALAALLPDLKLPGLKTCPFCGAAAGLVGPLPMVGCLNKKCPVRPGVNVVQLMDGTFDMFSKAGVLTMAELWNTRITNPQNKEGR